MNRDNDAIFKALADPTRRLMLDELSERDEMTLYELTARLIMRHRLAVSRQAIAKHLAVLEEAGLAVSRRRGKFRVIVFNRKPLETLLKRWLEPDGGRN
ncbi:MAG: transcriptional regulator [Bacillus thermozeamaize]|uniref:Transcriptional regulator n=1 Tax=Bacillus thermozeamaize TaxID=230954 RepID=A0A1Y3PAZ8_9BACI|nr:MAG: transcriptional regulator [Bacillus thermozeamaize]